MTTINLQVGASTDDAEQSGTTVVLTGTSPDWDPSLWRGYRFLNVTIAQGATIDAATAQFNCNSATDNDVRSDIYCEATDDATTFTTGASDISNRSRTTTKGDWDADNLTQNAFATTSTLVGPVQEVINRAGWASGNDLNLIVETLTGSNASITHYDGGSTLAAKLDIDYTAAAGGTVKVRSLMMTGVGM